MRGKGISYDTGWTRGRGFSRTRFDPDEVAREMRVIRDDLHCTAVRVMGGDPGRIEVAAELAAAVGLEVWFSPYPLESGAAEMLELFADCAVRAERLRAGGADVVFVAGAELSLMAAGFLPGDGPMARVAALREAPQLVGEVAGRVNAFLAEAVAVVRRSFGGPVTYAAVPLERVDWTPFDIVSVDLYRPSSVADQFADGVRALVEGQDKPVAITEFGAATYLGAPDRGAEGLAVVEYDPDSGVPLRLTGEHVRDEAGQAEHIVELLDVFTDAGVDSAFVFTFALHDHVHRPDGDPRDDLDLASYGIVRVLDGGTGGAYPGLPWEPKAAFAAVAERYR